MNNLTEDFEVALKYIFEKIVYHFSPNEIDILKNTPRQELYMFHFGMGLWIRNSILLGDQQLCEAFEKQNMRHLDDISAFIIRKLHDKLNKI